MEIEIEEQSGFRAGRSCIDKICCITQMIEKKKATNKELCLLFIDLTNAYDSTPLNTLWEALDKSTVNTRLIEAIKSSHKGPSSKMKIGNLVKRLQIYSGIKTSLQFIANSIKKYIQNEC